MPTAVFTVSGGPAFQLTTQGTDAKLTVGAGGPVSYDVTSSSNTFSDVLPGAPLTCTEPGENATVTVASDPGATAAIQNLVTRRTTR